MEIKGNNILLTPSEAKWIKDQTVGTSPDLARRVVAARREAAKEFLPPDTFTDIPELVSDIPGADQMMKHFFAELALERAEERLALDENGNEKHTITVAMSPSELMYVRSRALQSFAFSQHVTMNFGQAVTRLNESALKAGVEFEELTESDRLEADETLFENARKTMQVAAGIISATDTMQDGN